MKAPAKKPRGMGSHQSAKMGTDVYLTPPGIVKSLGPFDLDPCAPVNRPWDTAKNHYTIHENGLMQPWAGRVWLNPPYGDQAKHWLKRLVNHGNGIALIFARTETEMFFEYVWNKASSLLFLEGRLHFHVAEDTYFKRKAKSGVYSEPILIKRGEACPANAGAPSVLIAYGNHNVDALANSGIDGAHIVRNYTPVLFIGIDYTWKKIITMSLQSLNGQASVQQVYDMVKQLAPAKIRKNNNFQAKIRQQLQMHFCRVKKGEYTLISN